MSRMIRRKFLGSAAGALAGFSLIRKGSGLQGGPSVSAGLPAHARTTTQIKVIGIGGCGRHAINRIFGEDNSCFGAELISIQTTASQLDRSFAHRKVLIGSSTIQGRGAGGDPAHGQIAAQENAEEIGKLLDGADMAFVIAGMGGGTGTGAAPIVASIAKRKRILTVGAVTEPFYEEGSRVRRQAEAGLREMYDSTDTLFVVPNDLFFPSISIEVGSFPFRRAFIMAEDALIDPVCSISAALKLPGLVNRNFIEMKSALHRMGYSRVVLGEARGENRAVAAARIALPPTLWGREMFLRSTAILVSFLAPQFSLFELKEGLDYIRAQVGGEIPIIWSAVYGLGKDRLRVSILAVGTPPFTHSIT